jgi:NTP pyrophosphatase (non-canonical NTP hydrolase)
MFAIGDNEWAGLSKLIEEAGEVIQVGGKLMGSRGDTNHWSGDLREKLVEELGDLLGCFILFQSIIRQTMS